VEVLAATYKTQNSVALAETAYSVGGFVTMPKSAGAAPILYVLMTTSGTPTYGAGTHTANTKLYLSGTLLVDSW
jgi:hypothetical protein